MEKVTTKYKLFLKKILKDDIVINKLMYEKFADNYSFSASLSKGDKKDSQTLFRFNIIKNIDENKTIAKITGHTSFEEASFILKDEICKEDYVDMTIFSFKNTENEKMFSISISAPELNDESFNLKKDYFHQSLNRKKEADLSFRTINTLYEKYYSTFEKLSFDEKQEFINLIDIRLGEITPESLELLKLNYQK